MNTARKTLRVPITQALEGVFGKPSGQSSEYSLAQQTGLPIDIVRRSRGFVGDAFLKHLRESGRDVVSRYDATFAAPDPFPEADSARNEDPIIDGLALHELATNAVKYGALSSSQGKLSVSWAVDQPPSAGGLKLGWRERGGPLVIRPKEKGFGHVVIKNMIEQAVRGSVELDFAGEGLHWSLQAPASIFLQ